MARRKLIAGNWKMNGLRTDSAALVSGLLSRRAEDPDFDAEMLICPPATLLDRVGQKLAGSQILLGAQDCHVEQTGAFTGDVSAAMIKDMGAAYVLVGHSERRSGHHESNELIQAKADAALAVGLTALVCVGESEPERRAGRACDVVCSQLSGSIPGGASPETLVVAYERDLGDRVGAHSHRGRSGRDPCAVAQMPAPIDGQPCRGRQDLVWRLGKTR